MDQKFKYRLAKMIGLLGSDQDGEVLAAARATRRLLESERLGFGDLVALVGGLDIGMIESRQNVSELVAMADSILDNAAMLRKHELGFVRDIRAKAAAWHGFQMTEKQARWFGYLFARYGNI